MRRSKNRPALSENATKPLVERGAITPLQEPIFPFTPVERVHRFFEHGSLQTLLGILGGLVGVFLDGRWFALCGFWITYALVRSRALQGLRKTYKIAIHAGGVLIASCALFFMGQWINKSKPHVYTPSEYLAAIRAGMPLPITQQITNIYRSDTQLPARNKPDTFVQIKGVGAAGGTQPLTLGHSIQMNVVVGKFGKDPVSIREAFRLRVGDVAKEVQIQTDYLEELHSQRKREGDVFGPPGAMGNVQFEEQVYSMPLTEEDIDGIRDGQRRLYLMAALAWKNSDESINRKFECVWLQSTGLSAPSDPFILHTCAAAPIGRLPL